MKGWSQLLFLFLFVMLGIFVALVATSIIASIMGVGSVELPVYFLKIAQVIQAICLFILPAIIYSYIFHQEPISFLRLKTMPTCTMILVTILLMVLLQPIIQLSSYYNEQMVLPEALTTIEAWMRLKEKKVEQFLEMFLADKSTMSYVSNIVVVAVVAGVGEEILFRGCLQQIFYKITKNQHLAVWITAALFSAIHFQFYGFAPRMIAGAMLGYLFVWSRNLWIPILAHILHNMLYVILAQMYYGTEQYSEMQHLGIENHKWLALLSLLFIGGFIFIIMKKQLLLKLKVKKIN